MSSARWRTQTLEATCFKLRKVRFKLKVAKKNTIKTCELILRYAGGNVKLYTRRQEQEQIIRSNPVFRKASQGLI